MLRRVWPWLLVLIYWATRLHNLNALPTFLDEGIHIDWARLVWRLQPFHAASDGKLLSIWLNAIFWPFAGSLWVARASTVLATTVGFAALLAYGRQLRPKLTAFMSGAVFVAFPLSIFFDRMALVDAVSAAEVMLLVCLTVRSVKSSSVNIARIAGLLLAVLLLTKLTNIPFIIVPVVGAFILSNPAKRGLAWRQIGHIYLNSAMVLVPALAILRYVGKSDLGLDLLITKTGGMEIDWIESARINIAHIADSLWIWATPAISLTSIAGTILAFLQRKPLPLYLCLIMVTFIAALSLAAGSGYLEARYLMVTAPFLVLLGGHALAIACQASADLFARLGIRYRNTSNLLAMLALVVVLLPGARFISRGWEDPQGLLIPHYERWEYITGWPSGYGFREIALDFHERGETVHLATFDLGGQQRLDSYLPPGSAVTAVRVSPDELAAGVRLGSLQGRMLLALDHPKDDNDLSWLDLSLTEIVTYPRPGNESHLTVYEIVP